MALEKLKGFFVNKGMVILNYLKRMPPTKTLRAFSGAHKANNTLPRLSRAWLGAKKVAVLMYRSVQQAANMHAFLAGIYYAFPFAIRPIVWLFTVPSTAIAVFGKIWKRSSNSTLRAIAALCREFKKMGASVPVFLSAGVGFFTLIANGVTPPPGSETMIAILFVSIALSMTKYALDKKFEDKKTAASIGNAKRFDPRKFLSIIKDFALPIANAAGWGALLQQTFTYFITSLTLAAVVGESAIYAVNSYWLYAFVVVPVLIQLGVCIAKKATEDKEINNIHRDNVSLMAILHESLSEALKSFSLGTILTEKFIATFRSNDQDSWRQYIASMGVGFFIGMVALFRTCTKGLSKRRAAFRAARSSEGIGGDEEMGVLTPEAMQADHLEASQEESAASLNMAEQVIEISEAEPAAPQKGRLARAWDRISSCFRRSPKSSASDMANIEILSTPSSPVPLVPVSLQHVASAPKAVQEVADLSLSNGERGAAYFEKQYPQAAQDQMGGWDSEDEFLPRQSNS